MKFIAVVLVVIIPYLKCKNLQEEFSWTRISYALPNTNKGPRPTRYQGGAAILFPGDTNMGNTGATNVGSYIYENNIPMGANRWRDKLFITVPRRRDGVPSSLNYISINNTNKHNVPLIPYPNLNINQLPSSSEQERIVSVYRTAVDACDRLWMVDTGLIEIPGNNSRLQQASLVIINLETDEVIRRYYFKPDDVRPASTLASLVVDVTPNNCNEAFAYIPDLSGYGLIVYSLEQDDSWRVSHNYFYLESLAGEFYIGGINFQWNDGVFSVALTDQDAQGFRTVYFHAMAGTHIYSVSTRILKDRSLATRSYHENDFKIVIDRPGKSQTSSSDLHKPSGVLFLALVNQNALGCWNTNKPAVPQNFDVVHQDDKRFIYPSDVKIYKDQVIVLTNTMPVFLYSQLDYNEVNFRVWISDVSQAVSNTACANGQNKPGSNYYG